MLSDVQMQTSVVTQPDLMNCIHLHSLACVDDSDKLSCIESLTADLGPVFQSPIKLTLISD